MSKEAMKLALEALELNNDEWKSLADFGDSGYWKAEDRDHYQQTNKAITAIREALAKQPPQRKPLTDDEYEALVEDLEYWSRYVEVDAAHQSLEAHVRKVLAAHGIKENT